MNLLTFTVVSKILNNFNEHFLLPSFNFDSYHIFLSSPSPLSLSWVSITKENDFELRERFLSINFQKEEKILRCKKKYFPKFFTSHLTNTGIPKRKTIRTNTDTGFPKKDDNSDKHLQGVLSVLKENRVYLVTYLTYQPSVYYTVEDRDEMTVLIPPLIYSSSPENYQNI